MRRHIFDGNNRVDQKQIEHVSVRRWIPPTIGKGGNLLYAEPCEESPLSHAVPKTGIDSVDARQTHVPEDRLANNPPYQEARNQGLLLAHQEAMRKGLKEGREEGYQTGLRKGLKLGLARGHADGLQRSQTEINQQLRTLSELMKHLTHAINEQDNQLEQALLTLVSEIARHVVERELFIDSSHIVQIIRRALGVLPPGCNNVRILINPADLPLVQRAAEEIGENWCVISSQNIARGGCWVETEQSSIDFTTGGRFSQIVEQIFIKHFDDADASVLSTVPTGEEFEAAPQPKRRPLKFTTPADSKPGLADEAAAQVPKAPGSTDPSAERD